VLADLRSDFLLLAIAVLAALVALAVQGRKGSVVHQIGPSVLWGLIVLIATIVLVYLANLVRAPARVYWAERDRADEAERLAESRAKEFVNVRDQLTMANVVNAQLESELGEKTAERDEARHELERLTRPNASRLAIKNLAQAAVSSLGDRTRELEDPSNALAWLRATADWLRASVGEGEATRFFDLTGGTELVKGYKFGQDATLLWPVFNGTRAREWLEELIARADQVTVVQTFDPDEWKDTYA